MKWILLVIGLFVAVLLIYRNWRQKTDSNLCYKFFFPALIFKILLGISTGLVYTYYYDGSGDTFVFYNAAWQIAESLIEDPIGFVGMVYSGQITDQLLLSFDDRTSFFVLLISIPSLFSGGIYWIGAFYTSIISFMASWYLVSGIVLKHHRAEIIIASVTAFLFLPSVAFWTSGIFKESLTTSAIFIMIGGYLRLKNEEEFSSRVIIPMTLGGVLLIGIKYYLAGAVIPLVLAAIFFTELTKRINLSRLQNIYLAVSFVALMIVTTAISHPNLNLVNIQKVIVREYQMKNKTTDPEHYIAYNNLDHGWFGLASNVPKALFFGLFMPLKFTFEEPLQIAASCENLVLIIATLLGIVGFTRDKAKTIPLEIFLIVGFVLGTSILFAFTSPNIGTLSRYRVAYSPFFAFLVLIPAIHSITNK